MFLTSADMLLHNWFGIVILSWGFYSTIQAEHPAQHRWNKFSELVGEDVSVLQDNSAQEFRYRLPTYIVPLHYDLFLETQVHTGNRSYSGQVSIELDIRQQTKTIYVHSRGLRITTNELYLRNTPNNVTFLETLRYVEDTEREFVIFSIRRAIAPATYTLRITFEGQLHTDEDGFYISSYRDANGTRKYLASTQFQAISARSAFPCLDEPALKATFSVNIQHHPSYDAVSNMPVATYAGGPGYEVTMFETTPRMSIYLLAFMVSDFLHTEDYEANQRVFARPNAINQTHYPLEAGVRIMNTLNDYLGLPYNSYMPKIDQVALTEFSAGAMENWGLCKYREEYLLYEEGVTTYRTQTTITTIIAHEYAHQWFGNVVTNKWWSYLWLNEGFATLYEFMAADMAYPERQYRDLFNVQIVHRVLVSDAEESTRPMTFSRGATFNAILSLFDNIAYSKAGSVLQMFRQLLTEPVWRSMIRAYVERNEFGSVSTDEFVDAMIDATDDGTDLLPENIDIESFVKSWVDQPGYPVLDVRRTYRGDIILSQDRFYSNKIVNDDTTQWIIPYTILAAGDSLHNPLEWKWFTSKAERIPSPAMNDQWLLVNVNQTGFYRVNYDPSNWYMLIEALIDDTTSIPLHSRAQLIDDAFHLARSNRLDLEIALEMLAYVRHEREYPPWEAANRAITYFYNRMRGQPNYVSFQLFVDTLISDVFVMVNVTSVTPDERLLDKYLRQVVSSWACRMEIESCLSDTRIALEREVNGEEPVHPDVADLVYCYGLRTTSTTAFQYLYSKLQASDNRGQRSLLINALGCTIDSEQLSAYLLTAIGSELQVNYDPEERYYVLTSVLTSREGVDALIQFLFENYSYVTSVLGTNILNSLVQAIANRTNTAAEEHMLNALLVVLDSVLPASAIANAQSTVSRNLAWPSTREGVLLSYFLERFAFQPV
uniref:Aminopeptidase n=1 Tax=Anopheles farauti TaxID=69004 RepID=A0A182QWB6_9DIPT